MYICKKVSYNKFKKLIQKECEERGLNFYKGQKIKAIYNYLMLDNDKLDASYIIKNIAIYKKIKNLDENSLYGMYYIYHTNKYTIVESINRYNTIRDFEECYL